MPKGWVGLWLFALVFGWAQEEPPRVQDSICFRYQLRPGDSLVYYVIGSDSILTHETPPLQQRWFLRLIVVCDSVDQQGYFHFRQWIDSVYKQRWYEGRSRSLVIDTSSPWEQVVVHFEMNDQGWITAYRYNDTSRRMTSPGGMFFPRLWRAGAHGCWRSHQSWTTERLIEHVPENAYPPPARKYRTVFTARYRKDSSSIPISKCTFASVITQQAAVPIDGRSAILEATIYEYGFLIQDTQWFVPRHLYATAQADFTLWFSKKDKLQGTHFTRVNYYLHFARFAPSHKGQRFK